MEYTLKELNTDNSLQIAYNLGNLEVNEDFTFKAKLKWVRPFGMLLTSSSIKHMRRRHSDINFRLEYYNTSGVDYAGHMGFFKSISEDINIGKLPGEANGNDNYIPITKLNFTQMHNEEIKNGNFVVMGDVVEKESSRLAKILSRDNKEMHILLTYLIREILRNIPEHADIEYASICGQYWSNETAEVAIIDDGIGIKKSLQKNRVHRGYIDTDEDALKFAIKAGISKAFQPSRQNKSEDQWANSGFGLYMVSEICKELEGSFILASGEKYVKIGKDGNIKFGDTSIQGTAVKITISTNRIVESEKIIRRIAKKGEEQAKHIRNAFKTASSPSKGIINKL
ncbi:Signal transduction histidine kinase [[Clostridium] sordellii]|uniref:ATP-binding protein n=1 Tax=Paraclostridium sordellii TaxID=1505 RepID=UPI0005DC483F|nr:ATP-binding protein [Paeniclostridium sordellii]CEO06592.1 Signal transduction histidine kinase [[Clostridium] sordellii] [Paeniclostridium sordellii]